MRKEKKSFSKILKIFFSIFFFAAFFTAYQISHFLYLENKIYELQRKIVLTKESNKNLEEQLADLGSLRKIYSLSVNYQPVEKMEYLQVVKGTALAR